MKKILLAAIVIAAGLVGCSKSSDDLSNRVESEPYVLIASPTHYNKTQIGIVYSMDSTFTFAYGVQMGNNKECKYLLQMTTDKETIDLDSGTIKESFWVNNPNSLGLTKTYKFTKATAFVLCMQVFYGKDMKYYISDGCFVQ